MSAEDKLKEGDPNAALALLQDQIRDNPADAKLRIFLFQLLAVLGQWNRALTQLNLSGEMDKSALAMVQTYREALQCEALRQEVFAGQRMPLVFGDPEQWIALLLEALKLTGLGEFERAAEIREQAFELAPTTAGQINGEAFDWIADADSRLGPVLEAIVNGRYYWVPFQRIANIVFEAPADLRDRVWMPAYFTWANGGQTVGLVPTRYPGSQDHEDGVIRLAGKTDWSEQAGDSFIGLGQRMLATDGGDYAVMDLRTIDLQTADEAAGQEGAGEERPASPEEPEGSNG